MGFQLSGKRGLITGFANHQSLAFGCAKALHALGAELHCTYGHPKAEPFVQPLVESLGQCPMEFTDVTDDEQLHALFNRIEDRWGNLDFLIHSIAFAPLADLHGRLIDCSRSGFQLAMDISCHSFIRMAKLAEPLMQQGGTLLTMTYYGAEKAVPNYNLMGPVKAALESSVRYLADELGPSGIRVYALSPGPIATRAASGIKEFDQLLQKAQEQAALKRLVNADEVGQTAAFLVSDAASGMTGNVMYVDGGYSIKG